MSRKTQRWRYLKEEENQAAVMSYLPNFVIIKLEIIKTKLETKHKIKMRAGTKCDT